MTSIKRLLSAAALAAAFALPVAAHAQYWGAPYGGYGGPYGGYGGPYRGEMLE